MPLTIRPACGDDEAKVVALWKACGLVVPHNDPVADFRFALGKPNSDVLIAVANDGANDGLIVGSVMVGHDGHRGWLYYVSADPRGQGVGRAVIEAAEAWLAARGVPKAMLMIRDTNTGVRGFYETLGFETAPRVVMQKWLKAPDS